MRKVFGLLFLVVGVCFGQDKVVGIDSTGKAFVIFVREDSIGVVYQAKNAAVVTDGVFAKDFSAFDLKLKGFFAFKGIVPNLSDVGKVKVDSAKKKDDDVIVVDDVNENPAKSTLTKLYANARIGFGNARYIAESESWDRVSVDPVSVKGMDGYDFAPVVAERKENSWAFGLWSQNYVSIPGKRDVWKDGNGTYFLKPKGYSTNLSYNLMDFDLRFPDFTTPKGKIIVVEATPVREVGVNNYSKKGVSYSKYATVGKDYRFVGDEWLYELGCPTAYVTTQEQMDEWCKNVDGNALLLNFINKVYSPNKDAGYVMLNWEAVGFRWRYNKEKILRCLEYWATHEHKAKLALWGVHPVSVSKPIFSGYGYDYSDILRFNGSIEELKQKFSEWIGYDVDYSQYLDVLQVGGYQNAPTENSTIYHYLVELMLNKKYFPNKHILATIWKIVEVIDNYEVVHVRVDLGNGDYYEKGIKPIVMPSMMFNWGVWCTAVGDGFDSWSEPYPASENKFDYGYYAYKNGVELPYKFGEHASMYSVQQMKGIDWLMSGVWAVSANKDIVEASTDWQWGCLPSEAFSKKKLLIAYKLSRDGSEALVLAMDGFGKYDGETVHNVLISGKSYEIKTFGRYTSVIRLKL